MTHLFFKSLSLFVLIFCISCAKNRGNIDPQSLIDDDPPAKEQPTKDREANRRVPPICSALDFSGVNWPSDYTELDKVAFSLALNITGSFEGHAGWTNLSNNFDGQGFSMGILNQNLGQGSIQPLFIIMRDKHLDILKKYLKKSMLDSLLKMLAAWEKAQPPPVPVVEPRPSLALIPSLPFADLDRKQAGTFSREPIDLFDQDIDKKYGVYGIQFRNNKASVNWAKKTLYKDRRGRKFKPEWKKALKDIAGDPAYVTLQIAAAQDLHRQAIGDKVRLKWGQIRAYLYLFDLVVQNGGLKEKHFQKFDKWLAKHNQANEQEQMLQMLEIRVVDSHPKWQKDVRLRKTAVIMGTGYVHGEDRNLPVEYCYDPLIAY